MSLVDTITIPVCSGALTATVNAAGQYALSCSAEWQVKTGVFIDSAHLLQVRFLLDQGGFDWSVTYTIMGYCLGFWFIGAVFGAVFNLLRRSKSR